MYMLEQLFGSKTRVDMLRLFFRNPSDAYFVREITRSLDTQINAVRRELQILIDAKILIEVDDPKGVNLEKPGAKLRKYYRVNIESPLFQELQDLILKEQVLEEQVLVQEIIDAGGDVSFLLITGRFTNAKDAPADMLIVGNVKVRTVEKLIKEYEEKYDIPIGFTIFSQEEFFERRHMMDKFVYSMLDAKHIKVVNQLNV